MIAEDRRNAEIYILPEPIETTVRRIISVYRRE